MNEQVFNKELKKVASDLELHWDPRSRLWGVYQMRSSHFYLADGSQGRPWKLFDVMDDKGNFRLPDQRDIVRVVRTVTSSRQAWDKGTDWYIKQLDNKEAEHQAKTDARLDDVAHQAAKEAADFISTKRTRVRMS